MTEGKVISAEPVDSANYTTLESRMEHYRSVSDMRLERRNYVMVMLDGKNFSQKIKKHFRLPFDRDFIGLMNGTAAHACAQTQGAKLAYVQSDEISMLLTDFETPATAAFFDYRLCKLLSVIPSTATSWFNKEALRLALDGADGEDAKKAAFDKEPLYQFDAKAWILPTKNDVFAWFLYRQNDCVRNSKQQFCQTFLSHNKLSGLKTDEQAELCLRETGNDWNACQDDEKYGRLVYKETVRKTVEYGGKTFKVDRSAWTAHPAPLLREESGRAEFESLRLIPDKPDREAAEE